MMKAFSTPRKAQSGFTLLELMLSIVLLSVLMAGIYTIFNDWSARAVNRVAATDMLRFQNAAEDYVAANFDAIKDDSPNAFVEIALTDLTGNGFLPPGFQATNVFKQRMRVFRRNMPIPKIDASGNAVIDPNTGNPETIVTTEVLTLSDNPVTGEITRIHDQRLMDAAYAGGPRMGVVSSAVIAGKNFSTLVASPFSGWQLDLSDLNAAGYNASPNVADGGYLAVYGLVNTEAAEPNSDYLYRVAVTNRPELNRMETDLRMNGNRLENVGTVVADKVSVTGNAAFRGVAQGSSSATAQAMTIEQALRVEGTGESRVNMKSQTPLLADGTDPCPFTNDGSGNRSVPGGCQISGGELQVISTAGDATLRAQQLNTSGNIVTDITDVTGTTTMDGISTFEAVTADSMEATGTLLSPTVNISGSTVTTEEVQTATMDVAAGTTVNNRLVAAQFSPTTLQTTSMDAVNAVGLTGDLIVSGITATKSLYIDNVAGGYQDSVLGRQVSCVVTSGRTYCEPRGRTDWNSNVYDECADNGNGYTCNYYKKPANTYFGTCVFTRGVSADGRSIHTSNCS